MREHPPAQAELLGTYGPNPAASRLELRPDGVAPEHGPDRVEAPRTPAQPHSVRVEPLAPARYMIEFTANADLDGG